MDDLKLRLGRVIKRKRVDAGLTQERLAELADLHWTYVSGLERGQRNPTIAVFVRLAGALGLSGAMLLEEVEAEGR